MLRRIKKKNKSKKYELQSQITQSREIKEIKSCQELVEKRGKSQCYVKEGRKSLKGTQIYPTLL